MFLILRATSVSLSDGASAMSPTDAISIDPGMMMKLLMDSFGIKVRMHERYYTEMKKSIPQRDPSKVLLTIQYVLYCCLY